MLTQRSHANALLDTLNATRLALADTRRAVEDAAALPGRVRARLSKAAARLSRRAARAAKVVEQQQARRNLLLVLGIISNPRTPHVRDWIRSTYLSEACMRRAVPCGPGAEGAVLLRFVHGRRGLDDRDLERMRLEQRKHGDIEPIDASDFAQRGGIFSCIDKLFAWFPHAVSAYPGARFYAKADDDSYVDVHRLLRLLAPLRSVPNAYLGYVQYDSLITDEWKHCGWSSGPVSSAPDWT
jgi:hypothetical protein